MRKKIKALSVSLCIALILALAACGGDDTEETTSTPKLEATDTPTPTNTSTPEVADTSTPAPTAATEVTSTPAPTLATEVTATPAPTLAAEVTATPTPTIVVEATATPTPTEAAKATNTPAPTATSTPKPTATNTPAPTATNTPAPTATPVAGGITRNSTAIHTYTSFVDGKGNAKLESFDDSVLYFSLERVPDYAVFYGYSMSQYYNFYKKYFQEYEEDGVTVKTDYFQLLTEYCAGNEFTPVDATIAGYLETIASKYYGDSYKSYWTYFCFISEDIQEYQQLYDKKGYAKIKGYDQSDLYFSAKALLDCTYGGYTMEQYYKWYKTYGYFTVDGVDYYEKLISAMNGALYVQVTDEIKGYLQMISKAYWKDESYWKYFCSIKSEIIPEGKYEAVTTNYYKLLEAECGHNKFVKVTDTVKTALKYLSYTTYGDEQYWDFWCYTTFAVTGETATDGAEYTPLVDAEGEYKSIDYEDSDLYVNLDVTFEYTWNWGEGKAYTMTQWYSYGGTYADNFIKTEIKEVAE